MKTNMRRRYEDDYFRDTSWPAGLVICAMAVIIFGGILLLTQVQLSVIPRRSAPFPPLEVDFSKYLDIAENYGAESAKDLYISDVVRNAAISTRRLEAEWNNSFAGKMALVFNILSGKDEREEREYQKWRAWMDRYREESETRDTPYTTEAQDWLGPGH
jgi:hypothetical protein